MNNTKIVAVALLALSITGCAHLDRTITIKPDLPKSFYGTYLFVNPCHTTLASAADTRWVGTELAAALASGVVKTGVDWMGTALQRASQDDIEKTMVSSNLFSISQLSNSGVDLCLQIVRGKFKYAENDANAYANDFAVDPKTRVVAPLHVIEGTEELFIEILPVIHNKVISFIPLEVRYSGYTPSDRWRKKPRDLALFVGYSLPDKAVLAGEYTGRLINFGTLTPDGDKQTTIKYVTDDGRLSLINQTQWLSLPGSANDQPITFAANVIETREANQFSKFLATTFQSSKEAIKSKADATVADLEIFKTSKALEKEKIETEKEQLTDEKAYLDGIAEVLTKEETLAKLCSTQPAPKQSLIYAAQKDLYFARKKVDIAAASAGKSRPYGNIKSPDGQCDT